MGQQHKNWMLWSRGRKPEINDYSWLFKTRPHLLKTMSQRDGKWRGFQVPIRLLREGNSELSNYKCRVQIKAGEIWSIST